MIKKIFISILLLTGCTAEIFAQSSSSYTRIGIGEPVYTYSGRRLGMGQLGTSVADIDFINTLNPAGWHRLGRTRIEFGITYNGVFLSDNQSSYFSAETEFTGFTIGIPVSNTLGIGAVAGIIPYTDVSYKVSDSYQSSVNYDIEYEGRGGISKVFMGASYELPLKLSLGATFDYYFGNLNYYSRVNFEGDANFDSEYKRTYSPYSIGTTLGLISPDFSDMLGINNIKELKIGVAASLVSEMKTDTLLQSSSLLYSDTLGIGISDMKIPMRISAGLSFVLDKNYLFLFDFLTQNWKDYNLNGKTDASLRNSVKISAGFEYKPNRQPGDSFWEQIILRAGLSYEELPFVVRSTGINEYSVCGGFSLPLTFENTLDVGLQYASRGTRDNGLIKEDRFRISVGISLGDIWFIRQEK